MKYFPLKTVLFCILIIPILFTTCLTHLEHYLNNLYQQRVENHIVSRAYEPLNIVTNRDYQMDKEIRSFLDNDMFINIFNIQPYIRVVAQGGEILYSQCGVDDMGYREDGKRLDSDTTIQQRQPDDNTDTKRDSNGSDTQERSAVTDKNMSQVTDKDKTVIDMGLNVQVVMAIRENRLISNLILLTYMGLSLSVFGVAYKRAISKVVRDDLKRGQTISTLIRDEQEYNDKLENLKKERELLADKLTEAKAYYQEERRIASIAEEELVDEIVELEKRLDQNISLQREKEEEIQNLKSQLEKVERRKGGGKKRKSVDVTKKRFDSIYKNIEMNRKAVTGLLDLDEDMQIKAEEIIHLLNEEPSGVTVKRKVFAGKKNRTASFEVLFAYNGRLYFRNLEGNRVEILVIGTKNTQDKDMEFLHYI